MDVTALSDIQLDHMLGQLGADPFTEDYDSAEALRREKRRRLAARHGTPENVEQDLEASAAPMVMEPTVGAPMPQRPAPTREELDAAILAPITDREGRPLPGFDPSMGIGLSMSNPTDRAAYGQVFGDALRRHHQRGDAAATARRQGGYQDPEQVAYNEATGAPGNYRPPQNLGMRRPAAPVYPRVQIDGREYFNIDGALVPTESPLAEEVEMELPPDRGLGYTPVGGLEVPVFDIDGDGRPRTTIGDERRAQEAAQEAAWVTRHRRERLDQRRKYGPHELLDANPSLNEEQRANRIARREAEKRQARQSQMLRSRPGLQQLESDTKDRRRLIANRAMLAGGSSGLRGGPGGNMGMFTALAMLNGVDPESMDAQQQALLQMLPINADRAKIEAAQLAAAARMAGQAVTGALAGGAGEAGMERMRRERRLQELRAIAGKAKASNPRAPRMATERALLEAGSSPEEREMVLGELFGAGPAPAPGPAPPYTPPYDNPLPATSW